MTSGIIPAKHFGIPAVSTMIHSWVQMFDSEYDAFVAYCRTYPHNATLLVDNLLDNALTYTEKGSVRVRLASDGTAATLEVADTGIGIPPADQDRVFERFYRVDTARSREAGGTGLGLSLVRNAVRRGGGTIELESTVGKGSTFRVTLPLT